MNQNIKKLFEIRTELLTQIQESEVKVNLFDYSNINNIIEYKDFLISNKNLITNFNEKIEVINLNINMLIKLLKGSIIESFENVNIQTENIDNIELYKYIFMLSYIKYKKINQNYFFKEYNLKKDTQLKFNNIYKENKNVLYGEGNEKFIYIVLEIIFEYMYLTYFNLNKKFENNDNELMFIYLMKNFPVGFTQNKSGIIIYDLNYNTNINKMNSIKRILNNYLDKSNILIDDLISIQNLISKIDFTKLELKSNIYESVFDLKDFNSKFTSNLHLFMDEQKIITRKIQINK